jgi:hypothetical protein
MSGHSTIVEKIGIDPKRDDLNVLLDKACFASNWAIIEKLLALGADPNGTEERRPIENLIWRLQLKISPIWGHQSDVDVRIALENITRFASKGARWDPKTNHLINGLRRGVCKVDVYWTEQVVREFLKHNVCSTEVLLRLISTAKMKQRLGERFLKLKSLFSRKLANK